MIHLLYELGDVGHAKREAMLIGPRGDFRDANWGFRETQNIARGEIFACVKQTKAWFVQQVYAKVI